jgi:cell division protein FtsA
MTDHIREGIASCEFASLANRCIVLTGGTSELTGIADFVANELGRPVRVGHPQAISGLPPVFSSPAFSAAAGLLLAATPEATGRVSYTERTPASQSYLKQVGTWLREGF